MSDRATVTLSAEATTRARMIGEKLELSLPEVVRRGLMLLDLLAALPAHEELAIHDTLTGQIDRVRFTWDAP